MEQRCVRRFPLVSNATTAQIFGLLTSASTTVRLTYSLDSPYNCFPSLHVANSFISALACYRVHLTLGLAAAVWASLIGASTLLTKQHYVVDVVAGVLMAALAYFLFLRSYARDRVDDSDRRMAPRRAAAAVSMYALMLLCFWILYHTTMVVV
jgi:membrane-associated phospholipid phosphatase